MNEAGYCERMAEDFVGKLKGMGWECTTIEATEEPAAEPEQDTDDTEVLIPADVTEPTED